MSVCWCGAKNPHCADVADGLDASCGGSGTLHCYCGGDLCVCHNHGEMPCYGCDDCDDGEEWGDDDEL